MRTAKIGPDLRLAEPWLFSPIVSMATWPKIEQIVGMRDENWVKCRGFDKSQISAALSLAANSVLFDAKNAGNCISVLLDFNSNFSWGNMRTVPLPYHCAIGKFGTVSETSGSLGTNSSKHEQNKHGGREWTWWKRAKWMLNPASL